MEIKLALLADAANLSQEGKLNILGAFTNINSYDVPTRHPEMSLVLQMEASPAEAGMEKRLDVRLLGEDGAQVGGLSGQFVLPPPQRPGFRIRMGSILRLPDIVFPKAGLYSFAILIDGNTAAEVPLSITVIPKGGDEDGD